MQDVLERVLSPSTPGVFHSVLWKLLRELAKLQRGGLQAPESQTALPRVPVSCPMPAWTSRWSKLDHVDRSSHKQSRHVLWDE